MGHRKTILLVEDDMVDAMTVRRALDEMGFASHLVHLTDGQSALDYLRSEVNARPYLILLDLNMPRLNGLEMLKAVKADPDLARIPVVVLTTSQSRVDVAASFQSCVAGYMTKSLDYRQFLDKIKVIDEYWRINRLPGRECEVDYAELRTHPAGGR